MFKKPSSVTKLIQLGLKVCLFTHVAQHVELKGQKVLYTVTASMSTNYTKKALRQNTLFTQIYDENNFLIHNLKTAHCYMQGHLLFW
jgi:hypothetical protein